MKILCLVPVYNEEANLEKTIESIEHFPYLVNEFLFINNGSTDKSSKILSKKNVKTIKLKKNYGIGYAIILGIEYAINNDFDTIVTIHGGNKMDTRDFKKILDPIVYDNFDFVWGSRYLENSNVNVPKFRKLSIPYLSKIISLFYGIKITDCTNGFRAYRLDTIKKILPRFNRKWLHGYAFETFLAGKAYRFKKDLKMIEVPVTIRYNLGSKNTKIKPIIDYPSILLPFFLARFIE